MRKKISEIAHGLTMRDNGAWAAENAPAADAKHLLIHTCKLVPACKEAHKRRRRRRQVRFIQRNVVYTPAFLILQTHDKLGRSIDDHRIDKASCYFELDRGKPSS